MKTMKKSLAVLLAVLCLFSALSVTSFAATKYGSYKGKYGLMIPVKSDYKTKCSSYSVKADKGGVTFKFDSTGYKKYVYYGFTLYSDEARQNIIINKSGVFPSVDSKGSLTIDFSKLESGTYYGLTFTYVQKGNDLIIDRDSIHQFDIKLNKIANVTPKITEAQALYSGNYLKWNKVKYADFYRVYRKQEASASWVRVADVTKCEYTDKTAIKGEKYIYTVKAFDESSYSKFNKNGVDLIYLAPPKFTSSPTTLEDNKIKISWEEVKGAEKYTIYKKTADAHKYTRLATVDGDVLEYIDKTAKKDGETYCYTVKATNGTNSGVLSNKKEITLFGVKKPTVSCAGEVAKIKWDAIENATDYKLFKQNAEGQWDLLCSGADVYEYIDENVSAGNKYIYSLVVEKDGQYSSFDTKGVIAYCLAEPKITAIGSNVDNSVLLKWNAVEGATKYNIYRNSPFEDYELIGTTTKTSFYDVTEKGSNYFYTYYVEAANEYGEGVSGNNTRMYLYMKAPELVSAKWDNNGNVLKWKRVAGATSYVVLRRTPSGSYKRIAEVKDVLSYKDKTAKKATKYYYSVAALNGKYQGSYENGLGVNCLSAPEITSVALNNKHVVVQWNAVSGATGYYVYRKSTIDGSWKNLGKTTSLAFTDKTTREKGVDYYYTVKAYNSKGNGLYNRFGVAI